MGFGGIALEGIPDALLGPTLSFEEDQRRCGLFHTKIALAQNSPLGPGEAFLWNDYDHVQNYARAL